MVKTKEWIITFPTVCKKYILGVPVGFGLLQMTHMV